MCSGGVGLPDSVEAPQTDFLGDHSREVALHPVGGKRQQRRASPAARPLTRAATQAPSVPLGPPGAHGGPPEPFGAGAMSWLPRAAAGRHSRLLVTVRILALPSPLKRPIGVTGSSPGHQDRSGYHFAFFALARAGMGIKTGRKSQVVPACRDGRLFFGRRRQRPSWRLRGTHRLDPAAEPGKAAVDSAEGDQTIPMTHATIEFLPSLSLIRPRR